MYHSERNPVYNAMCPYYKCEFKCSITCMDETTKDIEHRKFKDDNEKKSFLENHCEKYPNKCPTAMKFDARYK